MRQAFIGNSSPLVSFIRNNHAEKRGGMWAWVITGLLLTTFFVVLGYRWGWTGFGETAYVKTKGEQEIQPKKTLWDWLDLLIVPAVLGLGALWFTTQQEARQNALEDQRTRSSRIAEEQRAQDEALQLYLADMADLLLDKDTPLRESSTGDPVNVVARSRTLTLLDRVDSRRKVSIVLFMYESQLIGHGEYKTFFQSSDKSQDEPVDPVVLLYTADLGGLALPRDSYLPGIDFWGADLSNARLMGANLWEADLEETELDGAQLDGADLGYADLRAADLSKASLRGANLTGAYIAGSASETKDASLKGADLTKANLTDADVTKQQLEQSKALDGATMPNGQKYEDWLKGKEGSGKDGEKSGPS